MRLFIPALTTNKCPCVYPGSEMPALHRSDSLKLTREGKTAQVMPYIFTRGGITRGFLPQMFTHMGIPRRKPPPVQHISGEQS